ncbi:MAG: hypothetical protein HY075_00135 [Deltaproteobacteria bacterium]|nr:hypothetical protein [Deltaproteobacteria bacterium]
MMHLVLLVALSVVSVLPVARADEVRSRRDRTLTINADYIHRPNADNKARFERACAQIERDVQLNFDRIVAASHVRPSELWVKTSVEAYYSHGGGRHHHRHFMGYNCVLELESRAEHLGFVTLGSQRFYKTDECLADLKAKSALPAIAFQRVLHSYEKLGFGREYCFVERLEVLPVYEGRRAD